MNRKTLLLAALKLYLDPHFYQDERFCRVWREKPGVLSRSATGDG